MPIKFLLNVYSSLMTVIMYATRGKMRVAAFVVVLCIVFTRQGKGDTGDGKGFENHKKIIDTEYDGSLELSHLSGSKTLLRKTRDATCGAAKVPSNLPEIKVYEYYDFDHDGGWWETTLRYFQFWRAKAIEGIFEKARTEAVAAFKTKGEQDAFWYALASYRVAREYSFDTAKLFGDAHERERFKPLPERLMALHNRETGRCLAEDLDNEKKPDVDVIKDALTSGKLQVHLDSTYNVKWPDFTALWSSYPLYDKYSSTTKPTLIEYCKLSKDLEGQNSCAIRVSRALIATEHRLYFNPHGVDWARFVNEDGERYIIRVRVMRAYLEGTRGDAKITGSTEDNFIDKKGIIVFEGCSFSDATGHVDLWNGTTCAGECYFHKCNDNRLFEF
ncbi:uncharacterized protein [Ptychodera flava]|uniref:uncharacterized protein n=1 Tax=Ptychodera flava TaxID=63121 RepID=UPI00396A3544